MGCNNPGTSLRVMWNTTQVFGRTLETVSYGKLKSINSCLRWSTGISQKCSTLNLQMPVLQL